LAKKSGGTQWGTAKFREETSKKAARLSSAAGEIYAMPIVGMQAKWCTAPRIFLHAERVLGKKSGGAPWGTAKFREETSKKAARLSSAAEGLYRPPIIGMQARLCVAAKKYFTTGDCSRDDDGRPFT
jgi:hypothetical protein